MAKDSKIICSNCEITGTIQIRQTDKKNQFTGSIISIPQYHCRMKNTFLNNINCGICNTFQNIKEKEKVLEVSEV